MKSLKGRFSTVCWILMAMMVPAMAQDAAVTAEVAKEAARGWAWFGAGLAIAIGTIHPQARRLMLSTHFTPTP